jgi:hypothetical protein
VRLEGGQPATGHELVVGHRHPGGHLHEAPQLDIVGLGEHGGGGVALEELHGLGDQALAVVRRQLGDRARGGQVGVAGGLVQGDAHRGQIGQIERPADERLVDSIVHW